MAEATIPVDLFNPGQIFACLGFAEAANFLLGNAVGRFSWDDSSTKFSLSALGNKNPISEVLNFLFEAVPEKRMPEEGMPFFCNPSKGKKQLNKAEFPIFLRGETQSIPVISWLDVPGLQEFKLFAGKQDAQSIYKKLLIGENKSKPSSFRKLMEHNSNELVLDPLNTLSPLESRFGFDSHGGQDALRSGFSLDAQNMLTLCSPVVEILAPIGLNYTRPKRVDTYNFMYSVVSSWLPISLLRLTLFDSNVLRAPQRSFTSHLGNDKYYKKIFFATEELS